MHWIKQLFTALTIAGTLACTSAWAAPAILPAPASLHTFDDAASLAVPAKLAVAGSDASDVVAHLKMRGYDSAESKKKSKAFVTVARNTDLPAEGYTLEVTSKGVNIKAADRSGVFYAVETLTQMLDQSADCGLTCCKLSDAPRMAYRGMMLDVVRCYIPFDEILKLVDVASQLKINKLHMHLTDDNGWRIEIKRYPKLTEVGAWRVDRPELFPARVNPKEGEPATYGGYYTQDEMRRLVAYAAERCIDVVPEIEMPAHSIGAIASYPELACPVTEGQFIGVLPGIGGEAASIIMCAGKDSTIEFVKNVLDEVLDIFPYEYIHLGGDEAEKSHWQQCPLCNERIAQHNLADHEALQGWFMDQIIAYVNSKGRQAIGWDEVTMGKPNEDIVIMGWRGDGNAAANYARQTGRRFIMTPAKSCYLIRYQGPQWFEPFTYFGNITLRDAYEFEPTGSDWSDELKQQMMGIQGSLWTEFCRTPQDMQYLLYPRLMALADVAWRPEGCRNYAGFLDALDSFLPRLDKAGVIYSTSMFNIQHNARPDGNGNVVLTASCDRPDAVISRVSNAGSPVAVAPQESVVVCEPCRVSLSAAKDTRKGRDLNLDFAFNRATGHHVSSGNCNNGLAYVLLNGLRGSERNSDFEWAGWYDRNADFTVDLGSVQHIGAVKLGALANANLNVAFPTTVKLYCADAEGNFTLLKELALEQMRPGVDNGNDSFPLEPTIADLDFGALDTDARYLRIEAYNAGKVPTGYPRENNATWLYFDELAVN